MALHIPRFAPLRCALTVLAAAAVLGAAGCTGPAVPVSPGVAPPSAAPPAPAPAPIALSVALDPGAEVHARLDVAWLRERTVIGAILQLSPADAAGTPIQMVLEQLSDLTEACGFSPVLAVNEVAAAGSFDRGGFVVAARLAVKPDQALACAAAIRAGGRRTQVGGHTALAWGEGAGGSVAVVVEDVLLAGPPDKIGEVVTRIDGGARTGAAPEPAREPNEAISISFATKTPGGLRAVQVGVLSDPSALELRAHLEHSSPEAAREAADLARSTLVQADAALGDLPPAVRDAMRAFFRGATVAEQGEVTRFQLRAAGDYALQSAFLGFTAAVGIHAVRRYLASAKTAEARSTVGAIGRAVKSHAESHRSRGKAVLPASAPRVPGVVPAAAKFIPGPDSYDHPAWRALGFSMATPQYYAYEYVLNPGGRTATVHAHGDLDGDGSLSHFTLDLTLSASGDVLIGPDIAVENEFE